MFWTVLALFLGGLAAYLHHWWKKRAAVSFFFVSRTIDIVAHYLADIQVLELMRSFSILTARMFHWHTKYSKV